MNPKFLGLKGGSSSSCTYFLFDILTTINPNEQVGVLLQKGVEGTSNIGKSSNKTKKPKQPKSVSVPIENEVTKLVQEPVAKDVQKEVFPSKTGVLKRTNNPAHRDRHSPERRVIEDITIEPLSSQQ